MVVKKGTRLCYFCWGGDACQYLNLLRYIDNKKMNRIILTLALTILCFYVTNAQTVNLDDYEIYLGDTLIAKQDIAKGQHLDISIRGELTFKPITYGMKETYYLDGVLYSRGMIENLKRNGSWEFWHPNGEKAREGKFVDGKPNGTHHYWFLNGNKRAVGNWKNGIYDGIWEMTSEDGKQNAIQTYKDGKLVE